MGPYVFANVALVGFFAGAALYCFWHWWLAQREPVLIVFAIHCLLAATFCPVLVVLATARTVDQYQMALDARTTIACLAQCSGVILLSLVSGVRARPFIAFIFAVSIPIAACNLWVHPLNGVVTDLDQIALPWGEKVVIPRRTQPGWWLWPVYGMVVSVQVFGLIASARMFARDRIGALLVALATTGVLAVKIVAVLIDVFQFRMIYIGGLPYAVFVAPIALQLSREYAHRGKRIATEERRVLESEAFLKMSQSVGRVGSWRWDVVAGKVEWSEEMARIHGIHLEDFNGTLEMAASFFHPEERSEFDSSVTKIFAGAEFQQYEYRIRRPDGSIRYLWPAGNVLRDDDGRPIEIVGVVIDITERVEAEQALRESQHFIQAVAEASPLWIYIFDLDTRQVSYMNRHVARELGYAADRVGNRLDQFASLMPPDELPHLERLLVEWSGLSDGVIREDEYRLHHADGTVRWFVGRETVFARHANGAVHQILGTLADTTERRQLQQQFWQSQKMEAIGLLAGGVAHDFNNLLTVIAGYSDILLSSLPEHDPAHASVMVIRDAGERAAGLTQQLLAFSRRAVVTPRVLDINTAVAETEKILRRLIGEDVQLTVVLDPRAGSVKVDRGQLGQVLMNLAVNARDAMPRGGTLTIETGNVERDQSPGHSRANAKPGRMVRLSVRDTGCGMPPEIKAHIFEPFFTTKGVGKGTGLGLAVVHGIVKQSGGHVAVDSEPDVGTTFHVYLPAIDEPPNRPGEAPTETPPAGVETILIVEEVREVLDRK